MANPGRAFGTAGRGRVWTVAQVLTWTAQRFAREGIPSARLDAELLLAHVLGTDRVGLYVDAHKPLTADERAAYRRLVQRRLEGEPVAYLLGHKEFWSLDLLVDRRVLVPRPETELLVSRSLELLEDMKRQGPWPPLLVDLGTGSGAIALAVAAEQPEVRVVATDVSADALTVARRNAERLGLAVEFRLGDLFLPLGDLAGQVDLLVSNPPYVAEGSTDLEPAVLEYEPRQALLAGPDGLAVLLPLLRGAPDLLRPGGWLVVEFGPGQERPLLREAESTGCWEDMEIARDLAGRPRCLSARLVRRQVGPGPPVGP